MTPIERDALLHDLQKVLLNHNITQVMAYGGDTNICLWSGPGNPVLEFDDWTHIQPQAFGFSGVYITDRDEKL